MKTQTDNSNIVVETMEDFIWGKYPAAKDDYCSEAEREAAAAAAGANWQKEQLLPLITILEKISKGERYTLDEVNNALQLIKP